MHASNMTGNAGGRLLNYLFIYFFSLSFSRAAAAAEFEVFLLLPLLSRRGILSPPYIPEAFFIFPPLFFFYFYNLLIFLANKVFHFITFRLGVSHLTFRNPYVI